MTNIFLNYLNLYSKKKNLNLEGGGSLFCQGKYLLFYLNNILSCVVTLDCCFFTVLHNTQSCSFPIRIYLLIGVHFLVVLLYGTSELAHFLFCASEDQIVKQHYAF
uniref:Uncharacterized protein n=1 Tax=Cacopsylla melanoneura TaxID=428564 RepID=A0A8D8W715_9HEMI